MVWLRASACCLAGSLMLAGPVPPAANAQVSFVPELMENYVGSATFINGTGDIILGEFSGQELVGNTLKFANSARIDFGPPEDPPPPMQPTSFESDPMFVFASPTRQSAAFSGTVQPGDRFMIAWDFTLDGTGTVPQWVLRGLVLTSAEQLEGQANGSGFGLFVSDEQSQIVLTVGQPASVTRFSIQLAVSGNYDPSGIGGTVDALIPLESVSITYVPVPEPGSLALLAASAGGLLMRRRRRSERRAG